MKKEVRELKDEEFPLAEMAWTHYRNQKADPGRERIFGVFVDGALAATARCTRHPGGLEMDCVFTLDEYRGGGYAREAVERLLEECGTETIYIHSTLPLVGFYGKLGFVPIPEAKLPASIRERFVFCFGGDGGVQRRPDDEEPRGRITSTAALPAGPRRRDAFTGGSSGTECASPGQCDGKPDVR